VTNIDEITTKISKDLNNTMVEACNLIQFKQMEDPSSCG